MKRKPTLLIGLMVFFLIMFSSIYLFSQGGSANRNINEIEELEGAVSFDRLEEYIDMPDICIDAKEFTSDQPHFNAQRQGDVITIAYYRGKSEGNAQISYQDQNVSITPFRDANNIELTSYIDNKRYMRPFFTARYTMEKTSAVDTKGNPFSRISKKELLDKNGNIKERYVYNYDITIPTRIDEFSRYAISPFKDEFRIYESTKFYYGTTKTGATGTTTAASGDKFIYYDVMDNSGSLKFTYSSVPPTYFSSSSNADYKEVTEVFVQYKSNVDKKNSAIKYSTSSEAGAGESLSISFDSRYIQYVIASKVEVVENKRYLPLILVFNGDGSLRQSIDKRATTKP